MSLKSLEEKGNLEGESYTQSKDNQKQFFSSKYQNNSINYIPFTKKWRVKQYLLNKNGIWEDKAIGNIFFVEEEISSNNLNNSVENISKNKKLILINEKTDEIIFNLDIIKENIEFHKQNGVILTWKNKDLLGDDNNALSFQEKEGLVEILNNINSIIGNDVLENEILEEEYSNNKYNVSINNLPNLAKEFDGMMNEDKLNSLKENLKDTNCVLIKEIGKILFDEEKRIEESNSSISFSSSDTDISLNLNKNNKNINETNNNYDNINLIFKIFKNLILVGDKELLEILFNEECYLITFAALEYETQSIKRIPHRNYFKNIVNFINPLNIQDSNLINKINQNLRLAYLRDTAFVRIINDNAYREINSIILNNQRDIVQFFIDNTEYFDILFSQMKSEEILIQKNAILFLTELISFSKNVSESRITFNEILFKNGLLPILSNLIIDKEKKIKDNENNSIKELIKINAIEIFISILSAIPSLTNKYLIENEGQLIEQLSDLILNHSNFGVKYEISQIFKSVIDYNEQNYNIKILFNSTLEKFINFLNSPIQGINSDISSSFQIIIEILMSWFNKIGFDSELWLEEYQINLVIIKLLREDNKIINLYAIKLLKLILENNEHYINIKIITKNLCNALIDLLKKNLKKNNMISSSLINLFDSVSQNDTYSFNIIMNYSSEFIYNNKEYFKNIILKYEQKPTPKKKLLKYLNQNTFTEISFKDIDIEPISLNNIINQFNEDKEDNLFFNDFNFQKEENEDQIHILCENSELYSNFDNKKDHLNKKRILDKNIKIFKNSKIFSEKERKRRNKNLNKYYKKYYKNFKGISLKEYNDDEIYEEEKKNSDDEEEKYEDINFDYLY